MPGFYDTLKGEPEEEYGIPIDAYIKYQMDNIDRVEHTNEDEMDNEHRRTELYDSRDAAKAAIIKDQMDWNRRVKLEEMVAQRLLDNADDRELMTSYYDMQKEWAESMQDDELLQTARELKIVVDDKGNIV